MNRRFVLHATLLLVAFLLTLGMVLPAITAAQGGSWISDGNNIYYDAGSVGIGMKAPTDRPDVKLAVGGFAIIKNPRVWAQGARARLFLGDYSHWIESQYGQGINIHPSQSPWNTFFIQEKTGFVGIGTANPKALLSVSMVGRTAVWPRSLLELSGKSGITGINLQLQEVASEYSGANSPMIKWDSTAYNSKGGVKVDRIWWSRAETNDWVLKSSKADYSDVKTVIRVTKEGEVCIGKCGN